MFFVLGFDKIQTKLAKTITTTNYEPHIKFYNYYLMDWYIEQYSPMKYVDEVSGFKYIRNNYIINSYRDSEAENEINEIKAKILKKDRPYFFKQKRTIFKKYCAFLCFFVCFCTFIVHFIC